MGRGDATTGVVGVAVVGRAVGGAWMGMSHALYETTEPYYPDRAHGPLDFNEYLMPGPGDLPEFEGVILERPSAEDRSAPRASAR